MKTPYKYSIIIPHYKIVDLLARALSSIPDREDIQILVVDDNSEINPEEFYRLNTFHAAQCTFIFTYLSKGAGYARNKALSQAEGKWLLFLDADDFFEPGAFDIFDEYHSHPADIIYFNTHSVLSHTLQPSNRFQLYKAYVENCDNTDIHKTNTLKFGHSVPVAKMIRHEMVKIHNIQFDETRYCNDTLFAIKSALAATKIYADKRIVYVVTEREGSLITVPNAEAVRTRYEVQLRANQLIRQSGYTPYQNSLLAYYSQAFKLGLPTLWDFLKLGIKHSAFNIHTLYLARKKIIKLLQQSHQQH